jgi:hypothetical protein
MTKKELINAILSTTSLSKVDASLALDAMPALKPTTFVAGIAIVTPVCGFLPVRAARSLRRERI